MNSVIHIWREAKGKPKFRMQTDDENVHRHVSVRKDFKIVGWGVNANIWIYRAELSSIQNVQKSLNLVLHEE
jgi:hypothetical protein